MMADDDSFDLSVDDHADKTATTTVALRHQVTDLDVGMRLDRLAAQVFTEFSRAVLQGWITTGALTVNGITHKPKYSVKAGDMISLNTNLQAHSADLPEDIALDICYEDEDVLVINKPAGLVVHPGAGNRTGTLVNALLYHYPNQAHLPRAGLVHRIDKDTTGLLMVAKTARAQLTLIEALKHKQVYRHYQCVVVGTLPELSRHRLIDAPIARHPTLRTKMAVRSEGKAAITHLQNITPLGQHHCLLDVSLETGRTHQIRVHLSHLGHGLVGDKVYPPPLKKGMLKDLDKQTQTLLTTFPRQALHAHTLGFNHPADGRLITVHAPVPDDMQQLIDSLAT